MPIDPDRYHQRYKVSSTRLPSWDYAGSGSYFITICTKDRIHWFGEITNEVMQLSKVGEIASQCWVDIPNHFPFVYVDTFIIMPDHMHGILVFDDGDQYPERGRHSDPGGGVIGGGGDVMDVGRDVINHVSTGNPIPMATHIPTGNGGITNTHNIMGTNHLGNVIRWFKGRSTFEIHKHVKSFAWQPRYYEHIIRNEKQKESIRQYIIDNPYNWAVDEQNTMPM